MTNPGRATAFENARLVPAVEYLQSERARMMMMMKLAEATADVDVYLVASGGNNGAGGAGGGGGRGGGRGVEPAASDAATPPSATPLGGRRGGAAGVPQSPAARHSNFANLACYPAVNIVPGFSEDGTPLSMTFFARPFGEGELLAVAKAYQDELRTSPQASNTDLSDFRTYNSHHAAHKASVSIANRAGRRLWRRRLPQCSRLACSRNLRRRLLLSICRRTPEKE